MLIWVDLKKKVKGILSIFKDKSYLGCERSSKKEAFKHLRVAVVFFENNLTAHAHVAFSINAEIGTSISRGRLSEPGPTYQPCNHTIRWKLIWIAKWTGTRESPREIKYNEVTRVFIANCLVLMKHKLEKLISSSTNCLIYI